MEDLLAAEAKRRRRVFHGLGESLARIAEIVREVDPGVEVYLFGSVAEGRYTYSSDIDVLIVTTRKPEEVIALLWRHGIEDPFEMHVIQPKLLSVYKKHSKLVNIE